MPYDQDSSEETYRDRIENRIQLIPLSLGVREFDRNPYSIETYLTFLDEQKGKEDNRDKLYVSLDWEFNRVDLSQLIDYKEALARLSSDFTTIFSLYHAHLEEYQRLLPPDEFADRSEQLIIFMKPDQLSGRSGKKYTIVLENLFHQVNEKYLDSPFYFCCEEDLVIEIFSLTLSHNFAIYDCNCQEDFTYRQGER